ncbi:MAG: leucyl/phenylalanyl-tRNA--protein transferase [Phycisphaeraceae bacterium]
MTPRLLVQAYAQGWFPMARSRHGEIGWCCPDPRAILPLEAFHVPHGLRRALRKEPYVITRDRAFAQVIQACAQPRAADPDTWISAPIIAAYTQLHELGLAHSVEAWRVSSVAGGADELVGGLYGVALGGAFFGESMFSNAPDASKICLVHLVEHLRVAGYVLLDVQFHNPHLEQFGIVEVRREDYLDRLAQAVQMGAVW